MKFKWRRNNLNSQLAANLPFNQHNLAPLSFIDVLADIYIEGILGICELNITKLFEYVFLWG